MGGDGRNQPSGGGPDTAARGASASMRAEQVIEAGLGLYSQGDLVGALKRWRQALEIDPDNRRAREYVSYVEDHYEVLSRRLRGELVGGDEGEVGPTIEMEADDPMDEIDAYDSVEVSIAEPSPAERAAAGAPTEEMKPHKLVVQPHTIDEEDEGEVTGEEATKAEGLARLRAARRSTGPKAPDEPVRLVPRPVVITEESVDEGWSLDGLEDALGPREDDTLEIASHPGILDDLSDLGARQETLDPYAEERDADLEEDSAIQRPSDDSTGEVTRPERRARPDSGRQRNTERSTPPPMPEVAAPRGRVSSGPPPAARAAEQRAEFDLADFDDPDAAGVAPSLGQVMSGPPAVAEDAAAEVRVTFRAPRESESPRPPSAQPLPPPPTPPRRRAPLDLAPGDDDESTVDRLRPPLSPLSGVSFDDETYERPSLAMLAEAAGDLDSLEGADSDDLGVGADRRPASEGDPVERETTQLYRRERRLSRGAASMELIAAELEADLDESVSIDPSLGEDAVKARVGWLINKARSENRAGHFPVAVVAIDLALEQHPDSAVAQKLIHSNREILYEVYRSFLGDMRAVPSLAMPMDKIPMHELDHRAAFLLSRIDGVLTLEDVLDVSGMARLEALRHLSRLLMRGILELRA